MIIDCFENKKLIADKFLLISATEGWNISALETAFEQSQIDKKFIPIIFENGILSLVDFITQERCDKLKVIIENNTEFNNLRTNQKISFLIFNLLKIDENNKISLKRLNNFYLNPKNLISYNAHGIQTLNNALQHLYQIADFIWKLCGDKSTDYNFYTKRLILGKVLLRSYIFFLNDSTNSDDLIKKFINQQIEKIVNFSRLKNSSKEKINIVKNKIVKIISDNNFANEPKNFIKNLPFIRLIKK